MVAQLVTVNYGGIWTTKEDELSYNGDITSKVIVIKGNITMEDFTAKVC